MTGTGYIPLGRGYVAIVDGDDMPELTQFTWNAHRVSGHIRPARRYLDGAINRNEYLYHRLLPVQPGQVVDHINGDSLDNAPVRTLEDLATLDESEMVEGYRDGFAVDAIAPGANRSRAYWWGFGSGRSDRTGGYDPDRCHLAGLIVAEHRSASIKRLGRVV